LDLRRDIRFRDKLLRARFDSAEGHWEFETMDVLNQAVFLFDNAV
jgi:hypothetical protein